MENSDLVDLIVNTDDNSIIFFNDGEYNKIKVNNNQEENWG